MIKLFNTLTRSIEELQPINAPVVGLYSCGPTVYHFAHIGNLRSYIFADTLKRSLTYSGYKVFHVVNITDVGHLTSDQDTGEDKMAVGAAREQVSVWDVAKRYTDAFINDLDRLNIIPANVYPRATDHIQEQIELIKTLEEKGFTYVINEGVVFDTSKLSDYGKLAKLDKEGLEKGSRVEFDKQKKNATDFFLWRFSPKDQTREMEWESPWGKGFPGWHIECSAMSTKYLGQPFDIHTGGVDHIPVHHTNEIAQSEAATGMPLALIWMHGAFLQIEKEKMAKSKENVYILQDLIDQGFDPLAFRYLMLNGHYRTELDFSFKNLQAAQTTLKNLREHIRTWDEPALSGIAKYEQEFHQAIATDLNTSAAIAVMWEMVKSTKHTSSQKAKTLLAMDEVLGLRLSDYMGKQIEIPEEVQELLRRREAMRKEKRFHIADQIRVQIEKKGYEILDQKGKTPTVRKI